MADTVRQRPVGATTFLCTAVESIPSLDLAPDPVKAAVARHVQLIDAAVVAHGGGVMRETTSDASVLAEFGSPAEAVASALAVQRAFAAEAWQDGLAVRVRIGVHTAEVRGRDKRHAMDVVARRCADIRSVAHGGQTLLSSATAALAADALPAGSWLVDHGVHRLRDLSHPERLFELRHGDLAQEFPPLRSLDVLPNNLPVQLTRFVGRIGELAEVQQVLAAQRLVTLAGPGGCGKTSLAVQSAARLVDHWPDGIWWIDLGSLTDPALVARHAAATIGVMVDPVGDPLQALASQLQGRHLLLCLDTCEHLLDACAELADTVLRACPGVSVLATSREPLGVAGETVWRVPPLATDDAARLFADRATLVRPGFALGADDATVRTICGRLDGIPLAIQLAAAWVRILSLTQIVEGMNDRFRLLVGGQRGVTARHRALAASMAWSYDLLGEADRLVFHRLAVFSGGFTLEAANAVCAGNGVGEDDVLPVLGRLVDKSLIVMDERPAEARYRLLNIIRQFAEDRLQEAGETTATRDRHLGYYLAFAETAEPELERDQDHWRAVLGREHDNLRSALQWALVADDPEPGRRLAAALARLWFVHGHIQEGLDFLKRALDRAPDDRSRLQVRLLSGVAMVAWGGGRPDLAAQAAERGLEIVRTSGDHFGLGRCLALSASMPFFTDFAAAQELGVRARHEGEIAGDTFAADFALTLEACTLTNRDRHDEAVVLARKAFERAMPRGERLCAAFARGVEVWAALFTGDLRQARTLAIESVHIAEPLGDYLTVGLATANLAWVEGLAGDTDAGRRLMEPIVRSVAHAGTEVGLLPWLMVLLGKLHLWSGDLDGAVARLEQAARFAEPMGDNWFTARALPCLASALRRLGRLGQAREQADRAVALARTLNVPHALAEALEESAFLAATDDPLRAERLHHEALAVRVDQGLRTFYVDSLEALAGLAADADRLKEATVLLAASSAARDTMGYPQSAITQRDVDAILMALRGGMDEHAFTATWARGAALSLDDAVSYAARARTARGRPSTGWVSLTPAEREVVNLAVKGLSNPDIGGRLFISRATVKTHLSHAYAKLGVANRTELAALASSRTAPSRPSD